MRLRQWLPTVFFALALTVLLVAPARAELFFEGQIWGEEFEDGPGELSRIELLQAINDERFEGYEEIHLVFQLELGSIPVIQEGVVRVRGKVFKADGSTVKLPMMTVSVEDGEALVQTQTEAALAKGDVIRWRVRFSDISTLAQGGACQVVLGVANKALLE